MIDMDWVLLSYNHNLYLQLSYIDTVIAFICGR